MKTLKRLKLSPKVQNQVKDLKQKNMDNYSLMRVMSQLKMSKTTAASCVVVSLVM